MSEESRTNFREHMPTQESYPRHWQMRIRHAYALVMALLMIAAFIAGGIFLNSAQASSFATNPSAKVGTKTCDTKPKPDPKGVEVLGTITAINGSTLTIKPWGKGDTAFTVNTNGSTHFMSKLAGKEIRLQDLKVGDFIFASGTPGAENVLNANEVTIGVEPSQADAEKDKQKKAEVEQDKQRKGEPEQEKKPGPGKPGETLLLGTITALNGSSITIKGLKDGKTYTITTDSHTQFGNKIVGGEISASDLKVGDFVIAQGVEHNGTLLADQLTVGKEPIDGTVICKK